LSDRFYTPTLIHSDNEQGERHMFFKSKLNTAPAATIIAACMLLPGGATAARADDLVTYTLSNVTFADGGTASGSFVVDRLVVATTMARRVFWTTEGYGPEKRPLRSAR
jgi:hypothetical protein